MVHIRTKSCRMQWSRVDSIRSRRLRGDVIGMQRVEWMGRSIASSYNLKSRGKPFYKSMKT